ncbi:transglycosylase [Rhodobacterales bacterium]|nr:transglycosylase [Rhodobacterales bacterium]
MQQGPTEPDDLQETAFADLSGWDQDDHLAALQSFLRFCEKARNETGTRPALKSPDDRLASICQSAPREAERTQSSAKAFFESSFTPYRIPARGFVTGYFEPEVDASRTRTGRFQTPLLSKPVGLEHVPPDTRPDGWPADLSHGRRTPDGLRELPDRPAIMDGALNAEGLELVWLADPIDAYFIHVQGSARLRLADGSVMRVGYAGKSGHPYTGIGRLLVERGEGTPEDFTMAGIRGWLAVHPKRRDALFRENRSYIFFREITDAAPDEGPVGAAGLSLVAGRSLAVDERAIGYGLPVFVTAGFDDPADPGKPFRRLLIADDTGSAIRGPARGDIFVGSGDAAGAIAGAIRHRADFTVLLPKPADDDATAGAN